MLAGQSASSEARDALSRLCQIYWYPVYAFVRRRGHSSHDAQDLTQEFFARLLERKWVARADQQRGRFRSFLLSAVNHFLANEWKKAHCQKRGGGPMAFIPWHEAETRFSRQPPDTAGAEQEFDRRWALALLESVLNRLQAEYAASGQAGLFAALEPALLCDPEAQARAALALELGMSDGAVRVALHRVRLRYRKLLQAEIAATVDAPEHVEEEMRHLFAVLSRPA
jgi:RNA polymerase sigma-70 factor (ECF subfamily)